MSEFIEVHVKGKRRLVNLRLVEEIWDNGKDGAGFYYAFACPDAEEQDFLIADENYEEVCRMIWR